VIAPYSDPILDSINEGVFTVDLEWRITAFNRAAERITGVRKQDAVGRACSDVFRASICEESCALRRTFSSGEPNVSATANIINASGKRIPIRISTALLRGQDGAVIGGVETFQDLSQVEQLRKELEARYTFEDIVGRSPAMRSLFDIVPQIAASHSTVLIEGESGTGKELFARALHNLSSRSKKRFVAVNCAALPDTLLESELFGYKAGAFTDARRDKPGRFVLADGGTIFLDEIGDVSPAMQVRLLRVLQERCVEPLGATEPVKVNVRVLAATNKDLAQLIREGKFRDDLFYRIRVIHLKIPALEGAARGHPFAGGPSGRQVQPSTGEEYRRRVPGSSGSPDGSRLSRKRAGAGEHHRTGVRIVLWRADRAAALARRTASVGFSGGAHRVHEHPGGRTALDRDGAPAK
jgi:PAS domain S-box-containing protein